MGLAEARRLRETNLPLSVISTRTGLTDPGYLVRRFKARYGTTPTAGAGRREPPMVELVETRANMPRS